MSVSVKDEMFYNSEDSVKLKLPSCNRNIQRSGSGSSSVQTSASIWSNFFRTSTFLTVSPLECCLSFRMAKIITVEPAVFLYMFGNFLFTILTQQYFFNSYATSIAEGVGQNGSSCVNISAVDDHRESNDTDRIVEGHATLLAVYCALPYRLLSLIFTLLLGPLSDNFGRRPVIIITMFGAVLQGICAFFIVHFNLNLYLFVLAYALAGLGGGLPSIMMASFSYVSDISTVKWRTVRIGIIESIVFLAGILSSVLGGLWFKHLQCQLQYPLILYIVCNGAGIVYTLILIPSSMSKMQRKVMNRNKTSGLQIITRGFKILFGMVETYRSSVWIIWVTLIPTTVIVIILLGLASVNIFFLKALDWGPVKIGAQVATSLSSRFLVLIIVLPILVAIRTPDAVISIIGTCFNLTMNLFMGLTHKTYQVFIGKFQFRCCLRNTVYNCIDSLSRSGYFTRHGCFVFPTN